MLSPHDGLFKALCQTKPIAIDLIKAAVPETLFQALDPDSLIPINQSFVSETLRQTHSDVVYQANINGHEGYVVFLLEHQSTPDELMAFRKLEYNIGIMRQHLQGGHVKLPTIINICVYHGVSSPYPYSTDIFDCFSDPKLAKRWMFKPFQLMDLSVKEDEEIAGYGKAAILGYLLKHAREARFSEQVEELAQFLRRIDDIFCTMTMLNYLSIISSEQDSLELLLERLGQALPEQGENIMTYGEQLIRKGMQQGMQQGIAYEKYHVARKMLLEGSTESYIAKITDLTLEELRALREQFKR